MRIHEKILLTYIALFAYNSLYPKKILPINLKTMRGTVQFSILFI